MGDSESTGSLIIPEGFGKAAEQLALLCRDVAGLFIEPTLIKRRARAEGEAAIIRAEYGEKVADIEFRARVRLEDLERRRQENLETMAAFAIKDVNEKNIDPPEQRIDSDWFQQFINAAQDFGNERMQVLWARILSGEFQKPGSFSLRAIDALRTMSTTDAEIFREVAESTIVHIENVFVIEGSLSTPEITRFGYSYSVLNHLETIGLLERQIPFDPFNLNKMFWGEIEIKSVRDKVDSPTLKIRELSNVGRELLGICDLERPLTTLFRIGKSFDACGYTAVAYDAKGHRVIP